MIPPAPAPRPALQIRIDSDAARLLRALSAQTTLGPRWLASRAITFYCERDPDGLRRLTKPESRSE